jgi:hypothetical protein
MSCTPRKEHTFHRPPASLPDHRGGNNIGKIGNIARMTHLPNNPSINASGHHPGNNIGKNGKNSGNEIGNNGNALHLLRLPPKQTGRGSANDSQSPMLTAIPHDSGNAGKNSGNATGNPSGYSPAPTRHPPRPTPTRAGGSQALARFRGAKRQSTVNCLPGTGHRPRFQPPAPHPPATPATQSATLRQ